jgi:hypothetical protein
VRALRGDETVAESRFSDWLNLSTGNSFFAHVP